MTPDQLLISVDYSEIEKSLVWVDEVKTMPLFSAGGVRKSEIDSHFVIVLCEDPHGSTQELLETFVHEILHIILFMSFPLADHEEYHPRIREVSVRLAIKNRVKLMSLLSRYLSSATIQNMVRSFS